MPGARGAALHFAWPLTRATASVISVSAGTSLALRVMRRSSTTRGHRPLTCDDRAKHSRARWRLRFHSGATPWAVQDTAGVLSPNTLPSLLGIPGSLRMPLSTLTLSLDAPDASTP